MRIVIPEQIEVKVFPVEGYEPKNPIEVDGKEMVIGNNILLIVQILDKSGVKPVKEGEKYVYEVDQSVERWIHVALSDNWRRNKKY